jgi:hypothetical protein
MKLNLDNSNSKISVRTRAVGMLAKLAHDLELQPAQIHGHAERSADGFTGELRIPVSSLRVTGQLHGDRVDSSGISNSDRSEIEQKLRNDVFAGSSEIVVSGRGTALNRADVTVETARGEMPLAISLRGSEEKGEIRISGRTELSLAKLGVREIKGPLGAFKVKDVVEVLFEITLRPAD